MYNQVDKLDYSIVTNCCVCNVQHVHVNVHVCLYIHVHVYTVYINTSIKNNCLMKSEVGMAVLKSKQTRVVGVISTYV